MGDNVDWNEENTKKTNETRRCYKIRKTQVLLVVMEYYF
jgi:hypothetical protein